ncbi:MAG: hypothetical protein ACJ76H_15740 [Bacteriovoracaceae bacterium]
MKTYMTTLVLLFVFCGCMKSKEDYRQAIQQVQKEEYNEAKEHQRQEERRERGSNDREGMGMDE